MNLDWYKKSSLYAIAEDWSPETVGRTLRELEEEEIISVDYYDGKYAKNLAKYKYGLEVKKIPTYEIKEIDGKRIAVMKTNISHL